MSSKSRRSLRVLVGVLVGVLGSAALAFTWAPGLHEFKPYRVSLMMLTIALAVIFQLLEPKKKLIN